MIEVVRSMTDDVGVFESGLTFGNPVIKVNFYANDRETLGLQS